MTKKKTKLQAPKEYFELSKGEKKKLLNQCGPDGPINKIIPNSLLGADISQSCDIHDYMFIKAQNKKQAKVADEVFLKNMKTEIDKKRSSKVLSLFRKALANVYFAATRIYSTIKK